MQAAAGSMAMRGNFQDARTCSGKDRKHGLLVAYSTVLPSAMGRASPAMQSRLKIEGFCCVAKA